MNLCKYNKALGEVNKGIHSIRIFDIAIVDVLLTVIAALYLSKQYHINFYKTLSILFVLGIILHRAFCVRTTVDKILFS
jgi:hypothetical protein